MAIPIMLWTDGDRMTSLPNILYIQDFYCAVIQMYGKFESNKNNGTPFDNSMYYLCCDIIDDSFVNGIKLPILQQFCIAPKG